MASTSAVDQQTGRKCYPDAPDDLKASEPLTFLPSLHGGGSVGVAASAAHDFKAQHRLVVDGMGFVGALRYRAPVPRPRRGSRRCG